MAVLSLVKEVLQLRHHAHYSRKRMERLQEKRLRAILRHAFLHSPYYHKTFTECGVTIDNLDSFPLSDLPVLTKDKFRENYDAILTNDGFSQSEMASYDRENPEYGKKTPEGCHIIHSSGSTGKPTFFLYDDKAWNTAIAGVITGAIWNIPYPELLRVMTKPFKILYIAATDGRFAGSLAMMDGVKAFGYDMLQLNISMPLDELLGAYRNFDPTVVIGYPSALAIVAKALEATGELAGTYRVITCGEPLSPSLRSYLESTCGCAVIDVYGASESIILGISDSTERRYMLDELNYLETIDGVLYLTSLYNYSQPLIRYRLGDLVELRKEEDVPYTLCTSLKGRAEDVLWFRDAEGREEYLHPLSLDDIELSGLIDYRYRYGGSSILMEAVLEEGASASLLEEAILAYLHGVLDKKGLSYVKASVSFIPQILPDPRTGKKRLVTKDESLA